MYTHCLHRDKQTKTKKKNNDRPVALIGSTDHGEYTQGNTQIRKWAHVIDYYVGTYYELIVVII